MEGSVGGASPPPPDQPGYCPLNPQATTFGAAGASSSASASKHAAAGVLGYGKSPQQPPFNLGDGNGGQTRAPPAAGGLGTAQVRNGQPSFADILGNSIRPRAIPVLVHPPAATDAGIPAAFFSAVELRSSCTPLDYTVIAKTPRGRPPFQVIRSHLTQRFRFAGDFVISAFDERHLLLRFANEEDYLKTLLKESMAVQGRLFRFLKWDTDFEPEVDSPVVPVWMALPRLPANYYLEPMLRSIAGSVGPVLQISENTLNMTKTHAAIVCVQLDVSKKLHDKVWIGVPSGGFFQKIEYINPPLFCTGCSRLGHSVSRCRQGAAAQSSKKDPNEAQQVLEEIPQRTGKERDAKRPPPTVEPQPAWRVVSNKGAAVRNGDDKMGKTPNKRDAPLPIRVAAAEPLQQNPFATLAELEDEGFSSNMPGAGAADPPREKSRVPDKKLEGNNDHDGAAHVSDKMPLQGAEVGAEGLCEAAAAASCTQPAAPIPDATHSANSKQRDSAQASAHGHEPEPATNENSDVGILKLPITHDVMCFPGVPEPTEDTVPRMHVGTRVSTPAAQGSDAAQLPDKPSQSQVQCTPAAAMESPSRIADSPTIASVLTQEESDSLEESEDEQEEEEELTPTPLQPRASLPLQVTPIAKPNEGAAQSEESEDETDEEEGDEEENSDEADPSPPPPPPPPPPPSKVDAQRNLVVGLPAHQAAAPSRGGGRQRASTRHTRGQTRNARGRYYSYGNHQYPGLTQDGPPYPL